MLFTTILCGQCRCFSLLIHGGGRLLISLHLLLRRDYLLDRRVLLSSARLPIVKLKALEQLCTHHLVLMNKVANRDLIPVELRFELLTALHLFQHQILLL